MNLAAFRFAVENATELKGGEYRVLLVLAYMADIQTAEAWPRLTTLAEKAHLSRRQTKRCLDSLVQRGYVRVLPPRKAGYPPTLCLVTGVTTAWSGDQGGGQGVQQSGQEPPPGGTSARTNHAGINKELVKEGGQLTGVSLSRKKRVRCAHEGCIYLTDDVFCRRHASEDTTAAKRA
jgi:hypothetical protein